MTSDSWVVALTFVAALPIEDKQLDALSDGFDELDWSVAVGPDGAVTVTAYVDDGDAVGHTLPELIEVAEAALRNGGLDADLVKVEAMTEGRRDEELARPSLPELLPATDVAKLLGVSRQRINQLHRDHPEFPRPVVHTGAGSLWTRHAVERFMLTWDRRPGHHLSRPADTAAVVVELRGNVDDQRPDAVERRASAGR